MASPSPSPGGADAWRTSATGIDFNGRRSCAMGTRGMVACSQTLATGVGSEILRKGGTAADAAVAVAAALNVCEPTSTGIGGDAFALYYDAKTKKVSAIQGGGASPAALTLDLCRARGHLGTEMILPPTRFASSCPAQPPPGKMSSIAMAAAPYYGGHPPARH